MHTDNEYIDEAFPGNNRKEGGFTVPDGYFGSLNNAILRKSMNVGFTVPEGYFDSLTQQVFEKRSGSAKIISHSFGRFSKWMIAASIIAISGMSVLFSTLTNHKSDYISDMNALSDEEIISYVDVNDIADPRIFEASIHLDAKTNKQAEIYLSDELDSELEFQ